MLAEAPAEPNVLYVEPGQLLVSTEPCRMRTILGSCVAVCLYDPELRHGGMNHFMLPAAASSHETSSKYGNRAMPLLLERLERLGSDRHRLCASVFGGACLLFAATTDLMHLGRRNVDFAVEWLEQHEITIVVSNVLGSKARRVELDIESGACSERAIGGG